MLFTHTAKQICLKNCFRPSAIIAALRHRKFSDGSAKKIVKSKVPYIDIPPMAFDEYVWKGLDKWHDKTALICAETGRSYLYSEMYKKSRALANFLNKFKGLTQGDTIAVVLPNVPEFHIVTSGAICAGFKVTTVNSIYSTDEIARQFVDSETKLVFTLTELWSSVSAAVNKVQKKDIPVVVIKHQQNELTPAGAIKFDEITDGDHNLQFKISRSFDDAIVLPYSSGTTGHPKGVQLTNRNLVSNLTQMNVPEFKIHSVTEGSNQDVVPCILPMFHIYGMALSLNSLSSGCKLITIPKFGSDIFLDVLEKYQPTILFLVPPIVLLLLNNENVRSRHIEKIKTIVSGAAPLGAADIDRVHKKFNEKVVFLQGYGLTETSPVTHYQTDKIPNGIKIGGCGLTIPNTECKNFTLYY